MRLGRGGDDLDERDFKADYERICHVLYFQFEDVSYIPRHDLLFDDNPTGDKLKARILKQELRWQFRHGVYKSISCSTETFERCKIPHESDIFLQHPMMLYFCGRICTRNNPDRLNPLEMPHCFHWWNYFWHNKWSEQAGWAISRIIRNMEKNGVIE